MKQIRLGELAKLAAAEVTVEGEIGKQIKGLVHRESILAGGDVDTNAVVDRIAAATLGHIDQAIHELQNIRAELLERTQRMRAELRDYENAQQNASTSLKTLESMLARWKLAALPNRALGQEAKPELFGASAS